MRPLPHVHVREGAVRTSSPRTRTASVAAAEAGTGAAAMLLLADGRFPAGAYAHSSGVEAAVAAGGIAVLEDLEAMVMARLWSSGLTAAAFSAAVVAEATVGPVPWRIADRELGARLPSPATRAASRALGRHLLRAGARAYPDPLLVSLTHALPGGPHEALALGAVARAAMLGPVDAALLSLHALTATMAAAAVRLLGLDPVDVAAMQAGVGGLIDDLASRAALAADDRWAGLPGLGSLLVDVRAEHHATWEVHHFAS